jgi:hypothetical protein
MLDQADEDQALDTPQALRDDAGYASLARHAVTDNGRALIAAVFQQVEDWEAGTRKRKRDSKAPAFERGIEGFVGDLLMAIAHKERGEGAVRRSVGRDAFADDVVTYHDFNAIRRALVGLGLAEETPAVFHWNAQSRSATRFRATVLLIEMAAAHGVSLLDIGDHFVTDLPKHPLVLKDHSRHAPDGHKTPGEDEVHLHRETAGDGAGNHRPERHSSTGLNFVAARIGASFGYSTAAMIRLSIGTLVVGSTARRARPATSRWAAPSGSG